MKIRLVIADGYFDKAKHFSVQTKNAVSAAWKTVDYTLSAPTAIAGTEKFVLSLMQLLRAERLLFLPMKSYTIRQYLTALKDQANAVMRFLLKSLGFKKEENFAVIGYGSQG